MSHGARGVSVPYVTETGEGSMHPRRPACDHSQESSMTVELAQHRITELLKTYGDDVHEGQPEQVAGRWIENGFEEPEQVRACIEAGITDPETARARTDTGSG